MTAPGAVRGTVVVPAHDEAAVIRRCLDVLLDGGAPGDFAVLVVSNGSADATAELARQVAGIAVAEIAVASKIAALRTAFAHAEPGPVVVVDADVEVPRATVRALLDALGDDGPIVAAARPRVDVRSSSWPVRRYYAAWNSLPYARTASVGSGVYAVNEAARTVVREMPSVVNDDGWVRRRFPADQRRLVDAEFTVHAARTVRALVARRARVINGNRELASMLGPDREGAGLRAVASGLRSRRFGAVDAAVFVAVTAAARCVALVRRLRGDNRWSTDTTSRVMS